MHKFNTARLSDRSTNHRDNSFRAIFISDNHLITIVILSFYFPITYIRMNVLSRVAGLTCFGRACTYLIRHSTMCTRVYRVDKHRRYRYVIFINRKMDFQKNSYHRLSGFHRDSSCTGKTLACTLPSCSVRVEPEIQICKIKNSAQDYCSSFSS